jgi:hypothetical protein
MKAQNLTGILTERSVRECLKSIGVEMRKPNPDVGVDFEVWHPDYPHKTICIQVKGRGAIQSNKKYRWFQIRTTEKQRKETIEQGLPVSEAWRKKVDLCDFFVLVSLKFKEHWVFPPAIIREIVRMNRNTSGRRKDNASGQQAEMDLDIKYDGRYLRDIYASYEGNFQLLKDELDRTISENA